MKQMNCIVTGGCGFLGSHLTEKLIQLKHKVTIIDNLSTGNLKNINNFRNKVKLIKADINDNKIKRYFKNVNWVFHLAAKADIVPSIENPKLYYDTNVNGTFNVLECSRVNTVKKFIYIASSTCYGIPKKYPTSEDSKIETKFPYALTKYLGEELVMHWGDVYKIPVISLRCFNIYGTRSRTSGTYGAVMGVFLAQKINDKPLTIVGNGNQKRDFTYVSDVVEAIIKSAKNNKKKQIFNIGSGKSISINYLAKLIGGKKIYIPKRPGEPDITFAKIDKIQSILKWKPKIKIEEGVQKLINQIKFWQDAPIWTEKKIKKVTKNWFKYLK